MHFSIEIETNCRETPKFSDLDKFLDVDRDFLVWTLMSRLNREISISTEISWLSRLTFENRRDYPSRRDWYFFGVEIEISIEITSRQIETPNLKNRSKAMLISFSNVFLNIRKSISSEHFLAFWEGVIMSIFTMSKRTKNKTLNNLQFWRYIVQTLWRVTSKFVCWGSRI